MAITPNTPELQAAQARYAAACVLAEQYGVASYDAWRAGLERKFDRLPLWFYSDDASKAQYVEHVGAAVEWQQSQAAAAAASASLQADLGGLIR